IFTGRPGKSPRQILNSWRRDGHAEPPVMVNTFYHIGHHDHTGRCKKTRSHAYPATIAQPPPAIGRNALSPGTTAAMLARSNGPFDSLGFLIRISSISC